MEDIYAKNESKDLRSTFVHLTQSALNCHDSHSQYAGDKPLHDDRMEVYRPRIVYPIVNHCILLPE